MEWTDIKTTVPAVWAETAEAIATGISGGGIYIEDYRDLEAQVEAIAHVDLIEQELLDKSRDEVAVHLYIAPDENFAEIGELMRDAWSAPRCLTGWSTRVCARRTGRRAGRHTTTLWISAHGWLWCRAGKRDETDRAVITLDPGMAFGTGTHETTALCLETLDGLVKGGERVLDIGTGSGILAIAALKLGAAKAEGVDIDPMCVRTAGENAALNGVQNDLTVLVGDLSEKATGVYDVICANIVANAIIHLVPNVPALLAKHGTFLASGIIDTRKDEVIAAVQAAGLALREVKEKNGWVALVCGHTGRE